MKLLKYIKENNFCSGSYIVRLALKRAIFSRIPPIPANTYTNTIETSIMVGYQDSEELRKIAKDKGCALTDLIRGIIDNLDKDALFNPIKLDPRDL